MYKYSIIGVFLLIFGCQSVEKNKKPSTLLNEDEMVNTLTELAILKATSTVASGIKKNSGIDFKAYTLQKIVDSTTIAENIAYYGYYPKKLKTIYLRVQDSLEKRYQLYDSLFKMRTKNISGYNNDDEKERD